MTPSIAPMVSQLRQLVFYHLDTESLDNANFLAGRLVALDSRNADSFHLLALTYLRLRKHKAAYEIAQKYGASGRHLGCAYIFALACQELGRYKEGTDALEKARPLWVERSNWNQHSDVSRRHLPDAPAVYDLLAKLWRSHGDLRKAGDCFIEAHKANPFAWDSFQGLCDIGASVEVANTFRMTSEMVAAAPVQTVENGSKIESTAPLPEQLIATPSNDPFNATVATKQPSEWSFQAGASYLLPKIKAKFGSPPKTSAKVNWETPTGNGNVTEDDVEMGGLGHEQNVPNDAPAAPVRKSKTLHKFGLDANKEPTKLQPPNLRAQNRSHSETTDGEDNIPQQNRATSLHKRTLSGHSSVTSSDASSLQPRRSNRLFQSTTSKPSSRQPMDTTSLAPAKRDAADLKKAKATGTKGRGPATVGRVVSGNRSMMPPAANDAKESRAPSRNSVTQPSMSQKQTASTHSVPDTSAIESLLSNLRQLGLGYYSLSRYDPNAAIEAFKALPTAQRETPWVLAQMGKAYYEAADYATSELCFARTMKLQPSRIEDTEVYSSVLWQTKKSVQLAFLAHTLRDLSFNSPQTWCVVGNAFSLSREHDQAIACFKRAIQLDPKFAYAHTLLGHELLTNEEFDSALTAYRSGVGAERRGYAGWYGLGRCYERMGKYEDAERHYRIAASINPSNAVLIVCIGVVLEKLRHPRQALAQYSLALEISPGSALARFKKARVLMAMKMFDEALEELLVLKDVAPEEANVFFLLGKCFKGLGDRTKAVRAFTTALNLDAKAAQYIKDAMEALDESDDEDEDDD
ncbi:hypothetical protein MBLNU457_1371t1 [Dothideomycetes sp. NU457]